MPPKKERKQRVKKVGGFGVSSYLPGTYDGNPRPSSSINRILKAETDRLAQEAERISLETYVATQQKKLDRVNRGGVLNIPGMGGSSNSAMIKFLDGYITDSKFRKEWLEMDDSQRMVLASSVSMMSPQNTAMGGGNPLSFMLPFMMAQMQSKPQSSMKDMVELIGTVNNLQAGKKDDSGVTMLTAMMPLLLEKRQGDTQSNVWKDVLNVAKEFSNAQAEYLKGELIRERNQPTIADQINATKAMAEAMGMAQNAKPDMEFERLKMDFQKTMADTEWNRETTRQKVRADLLADKNRFKTLENIALQTLKQAAPILDGFKQNLNDRARGKSGRQNTQQQQQKQQMNPQVQSQMNPQVQSQMNPQVQSQMTADFICPVCNTSNRILGTPEQVSCSGCGQTYDKQMPTEAPQ